MPNPREIAAESVLALLPMAGRATRLGQQSASKEVLFVRQDAGGEQAPLASFLLAHLTDAGIYRGLVVTRSDKPDIEATFGTGGGYQMQLRYQYLERSTSTPFTLAAALEGRHNQVCALGFADILFRPCQAYTRLLAHLNAHPNCDLALGLFPTEQPELVDMVDMVDFDDTNPSQSYPSGRVSRLVIKSAEPNKLRYTWSIALWRPQFSQYLSGWIKRQASSRPDGAGEQYVGDVIQAAIRDGFDVRAVRVSTLPALDAGTPPALAKARRGDW